MLMARIAFAGCLALSLGACVATGGSIEPSGGGRFKATAGATTADRAAAKALQEAEAHCAGLGQRLEVLGNTTAQVAANSQWAKIDFRCVQTVVQLPAAAPDPVSTGT